MIRKQKQKDKYSTKIKQNQAFNQFKALDNFKIGILPIKTQQVQISFRASLNVRDPIIKQDSQKQTFETVEQRRYKVVQTKEYSNKFLRQVTQPNRTSNGSFVRHKNSNLSVKTCMKKKKTNKQNFTVRVLADYQKMRQITDKMQPGHKKTQSLQIRTPDNLTPVHIQKGQRISTSRALQLYSQIYRKTPIDNITKYRRNFILKTEFQAKKVKLQQKNFRSRTKANNQHTPQHLTKSWQEVSQPKQKYTQLKQSKISRLNGLHHKSHQFDSEVQRSKRNCASILENHNEKVKVKINKKHKKTDSSFDDDGFVLAGWQDN